MFPVLGRHAVGHRTQQGLLLCGLPGTTATHLCDRQELAVGREEFIISWPTFKKREVRIRLSALVALAPILSENGCHIALRLLRVSLVDKFQYILAALHAPYVPDWAEKLTQLIWKGVADILEFSPFDNYHVSIISLQTSHGGWGILDLKLEARLIFLLHSLSMRAASVTQESDCSLSWSAAERLAIARLNARLHGRSRELLGKLNKNVSCRDKPKQGNECGNRYMTIEFPASTGDLWLD